MTGRKGREEEEKEAEGPVTPHTHARHTNGASWGLKIRRETEANSFFFCILVIIFVLGVFYFLFFIFRAIYFVLSLLG